jgi:N-acyl-D-amino-acid deacylase
MSGGEAELVRRLGDPVTRDRIAAALRARFGRDIDPEGVVIADVCPGRYSSCRGLSPEPPIELVDHFPTGC